MNQKEESIYFTVIVPVYNTEKYIGQCIESVLKQTYKNFELLLIDDGSTDTSASIMKSYYEKDGHIRLYHTCHIAQAGARNKGIECAKGDYITFLDADDYWKTDHLESLNKILCGCDMCISNNHNNIREDKCHNISLFSYDYNKKYTCYEAKRLVTDPSHPLPGATWLNIYKRKFLDEYNIRFNVEYSCSEDLDFFLKALEKARTISFYSNQFYFYRQDNPFSTINTMNAKKLLHRCMVYKYWYDYHNKKENDILNINIKLNMANGIKGAIRNLHKIRRNDVNRKELVDYLISVEYMYNESNSPFNTYVYIYNIKYYLDIIKRIVRKHIM